MLQLSHGEMENVHLDLLRQHTSESFYQVERTSRFVPGVFEHSQNAHHNQPDNKKFKKI